MTFIIKHQIHRATTVAEYECPVHGERFTAEVERQEDGNPPLNMICRKCSTELRHVYAHYRISAPLCRVNRISAIRGKREKPAMKTWLDTENLEQGQDLLEFRAEREKIRDEQRLNEMMQLKKAGDL